jgi:hypothetical protein
LAFDLGSARERLNGILGRPVGPADHVSVHARTVVPPHMKFDVAKGSLPFSFVGSGRCMVTVANLKLLAATPARAVTSVPHGAGDWRLFMCLGHLVFL